MAEEILEEEIGKEGIEVSSSKRMVKLILDLSEPIIHAVSNCGYFHLPWNLKKIRIKEGAIEEEPMKNDAIREEPSKNDAIREEPLKNDAIREEPMKNDAIREEPSGEKKSKEEEIKKEKTPNALIVLLAFIVLLQIYWLFFESKSATVTEAQRTNYTAYSSSSTPYAVSKDLSSKEIAVGVIRLKDDKYYPLTQSQKKQFLKAFERQRILKNELDEVTESLEKALSKQQLDYINIYRSNIGKPNIMQIDPSGSVSTEEQILNGALKKFGGRKKNHQKSQSDKGGERNDAQ